MSQLCEVSSQATIPWFFVRIVSRSLARRFRLPFFFMASPLVPRSPPYQIAARLKSLSLTIRPAL